MKIKSAFILVLILLSLSATCQNINKLTISYFGEFVTHPGFRLGIETTFGKWGKDKQNSILINPSIGFFHHKRYQTSYFVLPDIALEKITKRGASIMGGIGLGYQLSQVQNAYLVGEDGKVHDIAASRWYFLRNIFLQYARSINSKKGYKTDIYIKPQLTSAYPNFPRRASYFILEIGIKKELSF